MQWTRRTTELVLGSLLVAGAAGGCRTYVGITAWEPGPVNIGSGKQLVILATEGRRSAREELVAALQHQSRARAYFTVADQSESGARVQVAGRRVTVSGGPALTPEQLGVAFEVYEWDADLQDIREEERYNETVAGKVVQRVRYRERRVWKGEAVIGITIFNAAGAALLAEREYTGQVMLDADRAGQNQARVEAGREAIARVLADITPKQITRYVLIDKSDPDQAPMIEAMARGRIGEAAAQLHAYAERRPDNAAAAYNLAVCSDAMADYEAALAWYDRAIALSGGATSWYGTARDACARRRDAAATLGNQ